MSTENLSRQPENYKQSVKWIMKNYENAKGFVHGFQKDVIQNAVGARSNKRFKGWSCTIELTENNHGVFLIVHDKGTTGLTGKNYPIYKIEKLSEELETPFGPEERLARFSSRYNSGETETSAGLYGVGKTVHAAASKKHKYYFESISQEGYRANVNDKGKMFTDGAKEGDPARDYIRSETGLEPIKQQGTRIIIVDPSEDLKESIKNGTLLEFIEETWWRVITKLPSNAYIKVNGRKAGIPDVYNPPQENILKHDEQGPVPWEDNYKVKNVGLFVYDSLDELYQGFHFYRKGMKIGELRVDDVPKEIKNCYSGYIEVDYDWEEELARIEDAVHYDVDSSKKGKAVYRKLKNFANEFFNEKMKEWGYSHKEASEDYKRMHMLKRAQEEIEELFNRLNYDVPGGKGDKKDSIEVRWLKVGFPNPDSKSIYEGEKLSLEYKVQNKNLSSQKITVQCYIKTYAGDVNKILNYEKTLSPNEAHVHDVNISMTDKNSTPHEINYLYLVVKTAGGKNVEKKLHYYYRADTPQAQEKDIELILYNKEMPRKKSKRVNTGETIKNIQYRVENKTQHKLPLYLDVTTHAEGDNREMIERLKRVSFDINPFDEKLIPVDAIDLHFLKDKYENYMRRGEIILRGKLVAASTIGGFEKGDRLKTYDFKIFFNRNERRGIEDAFNPEQVDKPEDERRSWIERTRNGTSIIINIGHPAYKRSEDEERTQEFVFEQMLNQFVLLYLEENDYSIFPETEEEMNKLDSSETIRIYTRTVDRLLKISLAGGR